MRPLFFPSRASSGGGGTPGGSDTQVQFNDGSSFGGDADLTWNKTTNVLQITGALGVDGAPSLANINSVRNTFLGHETNHGYLATDIAATHNVYLASNAYVNDSGTWIKPAAAGSALFGSAGGLGVPKGFYVYTSTSSTTGAISDFKNPFRAQTDMVCVMGEAEGGLGINTATLAGQLHVKSYGAIIPIVVQGAVGQTLNLQQWRDSSSNVMAFIDSEGNLGVNIIAVTDGKDIIFGTGTGTKIGTGTTQKIGFWNATPVAQSTGWAPTNVTTDKAFDADATTLDEVADVLGTLINQLKTYGILGA